MLSYELAKKLKDAGFFQGGKSPESFWKDSPSDCAYIPTLSELIEACGDDLSHIKQIPAAPAEGRWWAVTHTKFDDNGNNLEECGATPEEAVADLWLSLNIPTKGTAEPHPQSSDTAPNLTP